MPDDDYRVKDTKQSKFRKYLIEIKVRRTDRRQRRHRHRPSEEAMSRRVHGERVAPADGPHPKARTAGA